MKFNYFTLAAVFAIVASTSSAMPAAAIDVSDIANDESGQHNLERRDFHEHLDFAESELDHLEHLERRSFGEDFSADEHLDSSIDEDHHSLERRGLAAEEDFTDEHQAIGEDAATEGNHSLERRSLNVADEENVDEHEAIGEELEDHHALERRGLNSAAEEDFADEHEAIGGDDAAEEHLGLERRGLTVEEDVAAADLHDAVGEEEHHSLERRDLEDFDSAVDAFDEAQEAHSALERRGLKANEGGEAATDVEDAVEADE